MRGKKLVFFLCMTALLLCGCKEKKDGKEDYQIYYLNADKTKISAQDYTMEEKSTKEMVKTLLVELSTDVSDADYRKPIPNDVEIIKSEIEGDQLAVWFDSDYYNMSASEEVLCRAAVVKTLIQIPDIACVSFFVGDTPLVDAKENVVGLMTGDSFVENPGQQITAIQTVEMTLYFSSKNGEQLIKETQEVHYSSNISIEKLVIEHLLEGPKKSKGKSAIPPGTNLLNVTTVDGICYVNFDSAFMNQDYRVQEPIVIYSIVNSLSELSTVSKVQISVNGSTKGVYRDSFKLNKVYDRNLDYLNKKPKGEEKKGE